MPTAQEGNSMFSETKHLFEANVFSLRFSGKWELPMLIYCFLSQRKALLSREKESGMQSNFT